MNIVKASCSCIEIDYREEILHKFGDFNPESLEKTHRNNVHIKEGR